MNRSLVLVATPLIAAPLVAMFLIMGGSPDSPESPAAGLIPSSNGATCGQSSTTVDDCPEVFTLGRRPLHC